MSTVKTLTARSSEHEAKVKLFPSGLVFASIGRHLSLLTVSTCDMLKAWLVGFQEQKLGRRLYLEGREYLWANCFNGEESVGRGLEKNSMPPFSKPITSKK